MPPLNLLIKPASGLCNMRCGYCFYADVTDNREVESYGIMSVQTMDAVVKNALEAATHECTIAFQGGEPTLAGLDFFREAVQSVKRHNTRRLKINYALQTNGYLIDDDWASFFGENRFLIGVSLDGNKSCHDRYRLDVHGKGTYGVVTHAIKLLERHGVEYNLLTVVNAATARSIGSIYGFYKRSGYRYQQYIPCLDPFGEERGQRDYSLTPERYAYFLKTLFDCWYQDIKRGEQVYNRYFENLVGMLAGYPPESCGMMGVCTHQLVVEADGGVYPCDFYVLDEYRLGNFATESLAQLEQRRDELGFIAQSAVRHPQCEGCRWFPLCRGGCRRDRQKADGSLGLNYYCDAYRDFFEHSYSRLAELAGGLRPTR